MAIQHYVLRWLTCSGLGMERPHWTCLAHFATLVLLTMPNWSWCRQSFLVHVCKMYGSIHFTMLVYSSSSLAADAGKPVTLVIQTNQGKRVRDVFSPSLTLWAVLVELGLAECEEGLEPVLVYMRQQVCCCSGKIVCGKQASLCILFLSATTIHCLLSWSSPINRWLGRKHSRLSH